MSKPAPPSRGSVHRHGRDRGFDPADYVSPADIVAVLLDDRCGVEVDERRPRHIDGGAGAHHTHDLVLRALRLGQDRLVNLLIGAPVDGGVG